MGGNQNRIADIPHTTYCEFNICKMASSILESNSQQATQRQRKKPEPRGGFDCEFVDPPPEHLLQTECPVCLLIIQDPHQVTCCGKRFCLSCFQQIKNDSKPCPACDKDEFSGFPDKKLKQTLSSFKVRCSHKRDGCEWTGELGQLDTHLSKDVCGSFPVYCPNECGLELPHQDTDSHVDNICPLTTINCNFRHVGCTVKLPRKDMPEHLRENLLTHISLLATSHTKQQVEIIKQQSEITRLQADIVDQQAQVASLAAEKTSLRTVKLELRCDQLKDENTRLKKEVATLSQELKNKVQSNTVLGLPTVCIANFKQHQNDSDTWYSSPVYTHQMGYKLCLRVDANGYGSGKGLYVSVGVSLMRGEFDHFLKWPFRGVISLRLLDRLTGRDHVTHDLVCDEKLEGKVGNRVTKGEISKNCITSPNFITHTKLEPKYLVDNSLCFQIVKVELKL